MAAAAAAAAVALRRDSGGVAECLARGGVQ